MDETQEVVLGYEDPPPDGVVVAQVEVVQEEKIEPVPQASSENGSDVQMIESVVFPISPETPSIFNLLSGLSPFEPNFQHTTQSPSGHSIRIDDLLCGSSTGPTSALESEPTSLGSGTIPPLYIETSDSTLITRKYASLLNYFKVAIGWTWVSIARSSARILRLTATV